MRTMNILFSFFTLLLVTPIVVESKIRGVVSNFDSQDDVDMIRDLKMNRGKKSKKMKKMKKGKKCGMMGMLMMGMGKKDKTDMMLPSIVDLAVGSPVLGTLVSALTDPGQSAVLETLSGSGPFTVFAPTNDAFSKISLAGLSPEAISNVLTYHVVAGAAVESSMLTNNGAVVAANGDGIIVGVDDCEVTLNGEVEVETPDLRASNGVVHIVDTVLMPPTKTIVEIAVGANFNTLVAAVQAAGLVETLSDATAGLTVFAPTDEAFAALPEGTLDSLLANPEALKKVLLYHVVEGFVGSGNLRNGQVKTLEGSGIHVQVRRNGSVKLNRSADVVSANILASNGIVHVIDEVLLPKTS